MRFNFVFFAFLTAFALVASACGTPSTSAAAAPSKAAGERSYGPQPSATAESAASPAPTAAAAAAATAAPSPAAAAGSTTINLGKNDSVGSFLVDDKGMTLYLYTKDTPNTSACYGKCATNWPPLLAAGSQVAGTGVDASKLGTTARTDGTQQLTYNGWPLYYFAKDQQAGDTGGQGVGSVWYLVSPTGDAIQ